MKSEAAGADDGGGQTLDIVILLLLLFLAVRAFLTRKTTTPPKWIGRLQTATPKFSFRLGFLLLGVFPTDILTSATVGARIAREGEALWLALPFFLLTLLLEALPALLLLVLGKRAEVILPKVRDWMNTNSWIVNEIVIGMFIVITVNSLVGG